MADVGAEMQAEMLGNRLSKNRRRLGKWAHKQGVTCYRIYDIDIPEIPLAIDWYEGRLHVTEHVTKKRLDGEAGDRWLHAMAEAAAQALDVPSDQVFIKQRRRQRGHAQYVKHESQPERFVVSEGGLEFYVNLSEYHDTGLFLDHRTTRGLFADEAADKRVLNLFCYTGAFTAYAAAAGARTTVSVDLSKTYLAWARENLALNGLESDQHRLIHADVLQWLRAPERRDDWYDLVIVDPPTWSTSKRMSATLDIQRDHVTLLQDVRRLLAPGGVVFFSTNRRKFSMSSAAFEGMHVAEITDRTLPEDFRARRPHRCWRAVKG